MSDEILPDDALIAIASDNAFVFGVLSSGIHVVWALKKGGILGPTPRYNKSLCFDPFPFPDASESQRAAIVRIAEALDKHRKDVQAAHPEITLTQMYNVLEKVRAGTMPSPPLRGPSPMLRTGEGENAMPSPVPLGMGEGAQRADEGLTPDEKLIFDRGLILILRELHEELDAAVAEAYGWPVDLPEDEILAALVALNKTRAAEEARGEVRWLRPEYQIPRFGSAADKKQLEADFGDETQVAASPAKLDKRNFPTASRDQVAAVMAALAVQSASVNAAELARSFKQGKRCEARVAATLASLVRTGFIAASRDGASFGLRRAA